MRKLKGTKDNDDMGIDDDGMGELGGGRRDCRPGDEELDGDDGIGSIDTDGIDADGIDPDIKVFLPGDSLQDGEVLVADNSAYEMLH
ncbi:hypothetical protein HK100_005497 [Physocladia obscura]|uniref:Uncharacterized protein n=1 Tax=Physocladia obscura TaxID=109957 RepID=A0AAD5SX98_9FUNG|nr:hypothetical protein HK100_005497 [Physocladia obscura]